MNIGNKSISLAVIAAMMAAGSLAGAATQSDDRAAALLAKHRTYVGWQFGDASFTTLRITGNVSDEKGAQTDTFVLLSDGPAYNNAYTYVTRGDVTEHVGFTGTLFWSSDLNGFTTPVYGDYAKFLASKTLLFHEGTTELPASYTRDDTIDGKPVSVVRVTLANADPIDLFIDPTTGAYVAATIDPGGAYETTYHVLSYGDVVLGKKMIASYRVDEDKDVASYTKFEPNVLVSDADLHPPAATASWTFDNANPSPITMTHDRMLMDATVNGVKGRFIIDTGADSIYLDDRFADRVNATTRKGMSEGYSLYGEVPTHVRNVSTIGIGGATLHNALVFSQDFRRDNYRGLDWEGYDGLLGFDLFAAAIVKLDVYDSKITVLDPTDDLSNQTGLPLLVDISEGIPIIPMVLNKTVAVGSMLDTGNPGVVIFGKDFAKKHGLRLGEGCSVLDSLAIGPITYANEGACEWESGFAENRMLLGFDFLKHFDFVFDYPRGRMFMTPNKN
jgi:predicted aspartyl protease